MAASYHVSIGAFQGPFDLLLHLIARHKVDIYDVPLAAITDDYLAVLRQMDVLDLEVTTEFLVVAATLIELKAARLLPGEDHDGLEDLALEARDLLYARLLDYRIFKEAAGWLRERLRAHAGYHPRDVPLEPRFAGLRPDVALPVDAAGLAAIAHRVLTAPPEPGVDLSHLQPLRMSVREAAGMVLEEMRRATGPVTFAELTAGCRHRSEVVVHFLALLELYKHSHIDLHQPATFGTLTVTWTPDEALPVLEAAALDTYDAPDPGADDETPTPP